MPPKKKAAEQASKKAMQKKKQQIVEDKTFGLKNKNKSKKVQQKINSIEKNVMNSGDPKMRKLEEQRAKAKAERKAKLKAAKAEQEGKRTVSFVGSSTTLKSLLQCEFS